MSAEHLIELLALFLACADLLCDLEELRPIQRFSFFVHFDLVIGDSIVSRCLCWKTFTPRVSFGVLSRAAAFLVLCSHTFAAWAVEPPNFPVFPEFVAVNGISVGAALPLPGRLSDDALSAAASGKERGHRHFPRGRRERDDNDHERESTESE
jgi:hypothetical protein